MQILPGSRPAWYPLPREWRAHAVSHSGTVLLETAGGEREDHISYLFTGPEKILHARTRDELLALLSEMDAAPGRGLYAAGYFAYEAGHILHDMYSRFPVENLATIGFYREPLCFDHHTGAITGPPRTFAPASDRLTSQPALEPIAMEQTIGARRKTFERDFNTIMEYLHAGDTYQVNYTLRQTWRLAGTPFALYESLLERQSVDFCAIVNHDDCLVLSFSPELFFRIEGDRVTTRPMKGTASRGMHAKDDLEVPARLAADEKNRAEHLMIVDLLRNDLGRIARAGTVQVASLFDIETYPTLYQMTSTITAELPPLTSFSSVFRALFPCGSITGAPKRRTMEIINELEDSPRGVYTGAIGFVSPGGNAHFSVPIRTLVLEGDRITFGVGGGIVADSTAKEEFRECTIKAAFIQAANQSPSILETVRWHGDTSLLPLHIERMKRTADELGYPFPEDGFEGTFARTEEYWGEEIRRTMPCLRMRLYPNGVLVGKPNGVHGKTGDLRVRISAKRILSTTPGLRYKTSRRLLYETASTRAAYEGFDEVLFLNERDELAEGAISNIFVQIGGILYTPPLSAGCLPGVLRSHLLATRPDVQEKTLRLEDLASADAAFVGNSLRGLRLIGSLELE